MQAVILAGGFGTRLRPLTLTTPKPLLPVMGRPVLYHQIDLLKKHGVKHIVLCLNYKADEIKKYLKKNPVDGVYLDYAVEPFPYGTAGAVKNAQRFIESGFFLVLNGDILLDIDISSVVRFFNHKKAKAVLALKEVKDPSRYGLVSMDRKMRIQQFLEKPSYEQIDQLTVKTINAGLYVLHKDVLSMIPQKKFFSFERDVFPALLLENQALYGFLQKFYWIDMGTPDKYFKVHEDALQGKCKLSGLTPRYIRAGAIRKHAGVLPEKITASRHCMVAESAQLEDGVELSGLVIIGKNCVIHKKAKLTNCILFNDVRVGENSTLQHCILGEKVRVIDNAFIENTILGDGCVIRGATGITIQ